MQKRVLFYALEIPYSMLYAYSSKFQHKLQSCSVFGLVSGCQRVKFEIRTKFTTIARNEDRRGEGGGGEDRQ